MLYNWLAGYKIMRNQLLDILISKERREYEIEVTQGIGWSYCCVVGCIVLLIYLLARGDFNFLNYIRNFPDNILLGIPLSKLLLMV